MSVPLTSSLRDHVTSRRRLLATAAFGLGGLFLAACSAPAAAPPVATATTPPAAAPTTAPVATTIPATATGVRLAGAEIRIGALVPSTGPLSEAGRKNLVTLKLVEAEINAAGGIQGVPLKIIFYDTGLKPDQAATLIRKLAQDDKVLAVAGPLSSSECEVVFPLVNQLKIVSISQASSKPGVSAANRPYAFRNTMDEGKLAKLSVAKFIGTFKVSKPAVIYDIKDAVSASLGKVVLPNEFKAQGVAVVNQQDPVTFQSTDTDLAAQVTKLKGLGADSLLMGADFGPASNVLREMNRQGLKIPVIGGSNLMSDAVVQAAGVVPVLAAATFYAGEPRPQADAFVKKFRALATEFPEAVRDPLQHDANLYDVIKVFAQAIQAGGITNKPEDLAADRERIMNYVTGLKNFEGVGGKTSFDQSGDGDKEVYVVVVKDATWALAG